MGRLSGRGNAQSIIAQIVDTAPSTLDTLNEIAAAINDDASFATTITSALGNKLDSSTAASTYLTQSNAVSTYLTQAGAASYLKQSDASSTYLTQSNASSTYAPIASPSFTGTTTLQQILEKITVSATAANTTVTYDLLSNGSITYYTSQAAGNWTLNVRGNSGTTLNSLMAIGQSLTIAFLVTNGATARYQTALQIDGSSVVPRWQGGTAPTAGNANSIDVYSLTIIKTANATFTALESQTRFA
jgi:hypothetical protein